MKLYIPCPQRSSVLVTSLWAPSWCSRLPSLINWSFSNLHSWECVVEPGAVMLLDFHSNFLSTYFSFRLISLSPAETGFWHLQTGSHHQQPGHRSGLHDCSEWLTSPWTPSPALLLGSMPRRTENKNIEMLCTSELCSNYTVPPTQTPCPRLTSQPARSPLLPTVLLIRLSGGAN